jgi:hypothetical protein
MPDAIRLSQPYHIRHTVPVWPVDHTAQPLLWVIRKTSRVQAISYSHEQGMRLPNLAGCLPAHLEGSQGTILINHSYSHTALDAAITSVLLTAVWLELIGQRTDW